MIVDKIFHIADVHIRNYQRHTEYNNVFKRLYKYIKENKTPGSIIYLAGDIVHQKTDLSPELVQMVGKFFKSCADLCPTVLICGNHDANLNNNSRLDSLTPIVENLKHRKLHYWKDSGVYKLSPDSNISFAVFSVFDSIDKWPKAKDIQGNDIKIALHHGAVMGATTDMDHTIENDAVTIKNFKGYDYGLLGDIHKQQYLNSSKTVAYSSSLIQQNYGETINRHGILVWDIQNKKHEFVEIENDIAYATFQFDSNQLITDDHYLKMLPKYLRVKVKHTDTDIEVIHQYLNELKKTHVFKEYSLRKYHNATETKHSDLTIGNVRDIEFQNQLISEYLTGIDPLMVDGCRHLNRVVNSQLNVLEKNARNTTWKLVSMEFSNMFSYGKDNFVEFKNLNGIIGIFAPNASGKSSLLEILTFALFDKAPKTSKADEILNNESDDFQVKVILEIENEEFIITRNGQANKDRKVRVDVDFKSSTESLKGKDRDDTNKIIRSYLGTYDDFMLTALSTQTDNRNFIFKTQRERKELLYSFLDLKVFTDLHYAAKITLKDKQAVVLNLENKLNILEESEILTKINKEETAITKYQNTVNELRLVSTDFDKKIKRALLNIVDIPIKRDSQLILNDIKKCENDLNTLITELIPDLKNKIKEFTAEIDKLGQVNYNSRMETEVKENYKTLDAKITKLNTSKQTLELKIKEFDKQIKLLHDHEYDPNCEYCCNNEFVKTAKQALNALPEEKLKLEEVLEELEKTNALFEDQAVLLQRFKEARQKLERRKLLISQLETLNQKTETYRSKYIDLNAAIARFKEEFSDYINNEKQFEINKKLKEDITAWQLELDSNQERIKKMEAVILNYTLDVTKAKEKLKYDNDNKDEIAKLRNEINLYSMYADAFSPNGIPYNILTKILPVIESEVNNLLTGICDFQVEFTNDEKSIFCHLMYGEKRWPVELASGMERFLVSVASRVALIEVTSLSRPNFIAIDEGFGTLDSNAISNVYLLFDKIKDKFDFILCITHLDSLKDAADDFIQIHKTDLRSYVNHVTN